MTNTKLSFAFALLLVFHMFVPAQIARNIADNSNSEIVPIIRERVEIGKTNQSMVVAIIDARGVHFLSGGKLAPEASARNANNTRFLKLVRSPKFSPACCSQKQSKEARLRSTIRFPNIFRHFELMKF